MSEDHNITLVTQAIEKLSAEDRVSIASLAKRYDADRSTIKVWLASMVAKGANIRTAQPGRDWRINRRDFERAFEKHYSKQFLPSL